MFRDALTRPLRRLARRAAGIAAGAAARAADAARTAAVTVARTVAVRSAARLVTGAAAFALAAGLLFAPPGAASALPATDTQAGTSSISDVAGTPATAPAAAPGNAAATPAAPATLAASAVTARHDGGAGPVDPGVAPAGLHAETPTAAPVTFSGRGPGGPPYPLNHGERAPPS